MQFEGTRDENNIRHKVLNLNSHFNKNAQFIKTTKPTLIANTLRIIANKKI